MNNSDWKSIAELIGIAAIVASLVFVGVQLRQDRQIAYAEAVADLLENGLESRSDINQYAHVLAKGNSGAELDPAESMSSKNARIAGKNSSSWIGRVQGTNQAASGQAR